MDIHAKPPESAYYALSSRPGEPKLAIALIAVARPDHPARTKIAQFSGRDGGTCVEDVCIATDYVCTQGLPWDSPKLQPDDCYREQLTCDAEYQHCKVTRTIGDREIKYGFGEAFAGLSQNYFILYAREELKGGTITADTLGVKDKLAAGYHLFRYHNPTQEETDKLYECSDRADAEALAELNRRLGTRYERVTEFSDDCNETEVRPGCLPYALHDVHRAIQIEKYEDARCWTELHQSSPVDDADAPPISITITTDVQQLGGVAAGIP